MRNTKDVLVGIAIVIAGFVVWIAVMGGCVELILCIRDAHDERYAGDGDSHVCECGDGTCGCAGIIEGYDE